MIFLLNVICRCVADEREAENDFIRSLFSYCIRSHSWEYLDLFNIQGVKEKIIHIKFLKYVSAHAASC